MIGVLLLGSSAVRETYTQYQRNYQYYIENGKDPEADLNRDYSIQTTGSTGTIENPLHYYLDLTSRYYYAVSPDYSVTLLLESSILIFPIIFGILGSILATNDYQDKTIRLRAVRMGRVQWIVVKQIVLVMSILLITAVAMLVAYITGLILYRNLSSRIPPEQFLLTERVVPGDLAFQALTALLIAVVFAQAAYAIAYLFKNRLIGAASIALYMTLLPVLGRFDLKNLIFNIAQRTFSFYGIITIDSVRQVQPAICLVILIAIPLAGFVLVSKVAARRSAYDC